MTRRDLLLTGLLTGLALALASLVFEGTQVRSSTCYGSGPCSTGGPSALDLAAAYAGLASFLVAVGCGVALVLHAPERTRGRQRGLRAGAAALGLVLLAPLAFLLLPTLSPGVEVREATIMPDGSIGCSSGERLAPGSGPRTLTCIEASQAVSDALAALAGVLLLAYAARPRAALLTVLACAGVGASLVVTLAGDVMHPRARVVPVEEALLLALALVLSWAAWRETSRATPASPG